jgi:hypothetical protein
MQNLDKPLLMYSEHCPHSRNFRQILLQNKLYDSFYTMNIDVKLDTRRRPDGFYQIQQNLNIKISKVPTIITPKGEYVLSDADAFKWLDHQINLLKKNNQDNTIKPFSLNEMSSKSDSYAPVKSTDISDDAAEQNFKFYDTTQRNNAGFGVLPDDNYTNSELGFHGKSGDSFVAGFLDTSNAENPDYNSVQAERQFFDESRQKQNVGRMNQQDFKQQYDKGSGGQANQAFQMRQESYNQGMGRSQAQPQIDFTDPNLGLSGKFGQQGPKTSLKTQEMESRLSELMNAREQQGF